MPTRIETVFEIPETELLQSIQDFSDSHAKIVTAINDGKGTFSVEATFIAAAPQGGSITKHGKMSTFGGPKDTGVSPSEGLALYDASSVGTAPAGLFLNTQPP